MQTLGKPSERNEARQARPRPALVTVVLPVKRNEPNVATQLAALASQTYTDQWELVIVQNGGGEPSETTLERFRNRLPEVIVVQCERRGVNSARSAGVAAARGDFLAFCDADDEVVPEWLEALAEKSGDADLVAGRVDFVTLNDGLRTAWNGGLPLQPATQANVGLGFLPFASGGNCGAWADVVRQIGFDESFTHGGTDLEFSWRVQLAGFRMGFEPRAVIRYRYRTRMSGLAAQWFSFGVGEAHVFRCFREHGMRRRRNIEVAKTWAWLAWRLPRALRSRAAAGNWLRVAAASAGRIWGSVRWRVVYL